MEYLDGLRTRRSVPVRDMVDTPIAADHIEAMLSLATRTPDHGKLAPWRLVVIDKPAQIAFGSIVSARYEQLNPNAEAASIAFERNRISRAPLVVAVISHTVAGKIPTWEQYMSAGAVCMNLLHAAHAMGYGAKWLTEWIAYDEQIIDALGGRAGERIAGFVYIGAAKETPPERERPALADVVKWWRG